jgi:hypothetical protein
LQRHALDVATQLNLFDEESIPSLPVLGALIGAITNVTYQDAGGTITIGVTGQSEILKLISAALEPRLMSILIAKAVADEILSALKEGGYAVVPKAPTKQMLDEGWYEANEENALGVWRDMIEAWESTLKHGELGQGQG